MIGSLSVDQLRNGGRAAGSRHKRSQDTRQRDSELGVNRNGGLATAVASPARHAANAGEGAGVEVTRRQAVAIWQTRRATIAQTLL